MITEANKPIQPFANLHVEEVLGGVSLRSLAELHNNPDHPANARVCFRCSHCDTWLEGTYFFAFVTACDECRQKAEKAERMERARIYWEAICPPGLRDTDTTHAGFPKAQHVATKDYAGKESLLLFGDSRSGKTRLAMLLAKRCLVKYGMHVGVLWPEQLKAMKKSFTPLEDIAKWGRYEVLVMDDSLLTAASDSRLTEVFKDLLDYRMRYNRVNIITSQIGSEDYEEQSGKFAEATGADKKLIEALCERVREICTVVPFAKARELVEVQEEAPW